MSVKSDIEILVKNDYSLERIADKCRVSFITVWRWSKGLPSHNKLAEDKITLWASRIRRAQGASNAR